MARLSDHGTALRWDECDCVACIQRKPRPTLRWPVGPLVDEFGAEVVKRSVTCRTWPVVCLHGLTDEEADHAAIALGRHPGVVWKGWFDAGLDLTGPDDDDDRDG